LPWHGALEVNGQRLSSGDAALLEDERRIVLEAGRSGRLELGIAHQ
jgi:hypothetical protein